MSSKAEGGLKDRCCICFKTVSCKEAVLPVSHFSLQGKSIQFLTLPVCDNCISSIEHQCREVLEDYSWEVIFEAWHSTFPSIAVSGVDDVCWLLQLLAAKKDDSPP